MSEDGATFDTIYFDNDDYYEGEVLEGMPHGEGVMYYANGLTRAGYWLYGLPTTSGTPDDKIPNSKPCLKEIENNGYVFRVGFGYDNETMREAFKITGYRRGIRLHDDVAVLLSIKNSVYDRSNSIEKWDVDDDGEDIFRYVGEGPEGDQSLKAGNLFLNNMRGHIYLFVTRKPDDYVFHGKVEVKRVEKDIQPDKFGKERKVYIFVLRRI